MGTQIAVAAHKDCRNVRRTSRTECALRPNSAAINGEAATTIPMPISSMAITIPDPKADAASASGPSRASRNTSVALISTIVMLVRINGQASASVARNSSRQGDWRSIVIAAVVMGVGG